MILSVKLFMRRWIYIWYFSRILRALNIYRNSEEKNKFHEKKTKPPLKKCHIASMKGTEACVRKWDKRICGRGRANVRRSNACERDARNAIGQWAFRVVHGISDCDEQEKGEMLIRDCVWISQDKWHECWAIESCRMVEWERRREGDRCSEHSSNAIWQKLRCLEYSVDVLGRVCVCVRVEIWVCVVCVCERALVSVERVLAVCQT